MRESDAVDLDLYSVPVLGPQEDDLCSGTLHAFVSKIPRASEAKPDLIT